MLPILLLLAGFAALIYGANQMVNGASSLAKRMNISDIVIGLTIVAFGTSAPELVVNTLAAINKNTEMVLGNVIGSNVFNVLVILGITALIAPLNVKKSTTWIEIPLSLLAALAVWLMANDTLLNRIDADAILRSDGILLLLFFTIFMGYNLAVAKKEPHEENLNLPSISIPKSIFLTLFGLVLLIVGGNLIVDNAVLIAQKIGLSERVIALTIVSVGTSLPELATSIVAVRKGNVDLAIGNVVGSNIFNSFLILGVSAIISPVQVTTNAQPDLLLNIIAGLLLFIFVFMGKGRVISRIEGFIFLVIYTSYIFWLL
ncbi:MAG: sodium:proton exchanger [Bacteroidetes bacterium HGW-Bacteroidetes-4]|jgi:cation:H+ antiporter|nr:MAG: sodium:proton exchanger [Bacteroidetes bacterium HGW-Bacteroidetes-4]